MSGRIVGAAVDRAGSAVSTFTERGVDAPDAVDDRVYNGRGFLPHVVAAARHRLRLSPKPSSITFQARIAIAIASKA
jgi:hypothetical protein